MIDITVYTSKVGLYWNFSMVVFSEKSMDVGKSWKSLFQIGEIY